MTNKYPSEDDLLKAKGVHLIQTYGDGRPDAWQQCRIIKRAGQLIAITTQGSVEYETPVPSNANIDWSTDKTIVVSFKAEDKA
jgi:hypothetical protein